MIKRFDLGGAENYVCDLANKLAELNHKVWIASPKGRKLQELSPAVNHLSLSYQDILSLFLSISIAKFVRREKIDIIHAHQRLPIKIGCLVSFTTGVPVVATVHGQLRYDLRSRFVRYALHRIIVISKYYRQRASNDFLLRPKIVYIPNGVAGKLIKASENHQFKLVYGSRLDKSHTEILTTIISRVMPQLLSLYPTVELEVAGDGYNLTKLRRVASKVNAREGREVVKFLGYKGDISPAISSGRLTLGVGRVALESIALGIPVISLNHAHMGSPLSFSNFYHLREKNFVSVDNLPPQPEGIIEAIKTVLDNHEFYKNETKKMQQIVLKEHKLENVTEQILNVYKETIAFPHPRIYLR